jgi:hypothetical protein
MDGQSPQSRQLIENEGSRNRFFRSQSRQHAEKKSTYNNLPKTEDMRANCPKLSAPNCRWQAVLTPILFTFWASIS